MTTRNLLLFIFLLNATTIIAQNNYQSTTSPSCPIYFTEQAIPTANSGIDISTGNINPVLKLFSLKGRTIELPIELNYNGGGFRVNDVAGILGLGWNLKTGGYIKRTVRGIRDEMIYPDMRAYNPNFENPACGWLDYSAYTTFTNPVRLTDGSSGQCVSFYKSMETPGGFNNSAGSYKSWQISYFAEAMGRNFVGGIDTEPDVFTFQFGNYSGNFVFDQYGDPKLVPFQNIKITPGFDKHGVIQDKWVFTVEDGTQYEFSFREDYIDRVTTITNIPTIDVPATERNESKYKSSYISTWYLTKIITSLGEEVNFSYTSSNAIDYVNKSVARLDFIPTAEAPDPFFSTTPASPYLPGNGAFEFPTDAETVISHPKQIQQITTVLGKVTFSPSTIQRLDLPGSYALGQIRLENNDGMDIRYIFNYDHFNSGCSTSDCYRLKLKSISLVNGSDNAQINPYTFEYASINLPARNTFQQDKWGFYNSNTFPSLVPRKQYSTIQGVKVFDGADKSPDATKMQACMLNKIIYATAGYSQFLYQTNDFLDKASGTNKLTGGLRIWKIIRSDGINTQNDVVTEYRYELDDVSGKSSGQAPSDAETIEFQHYNLYGATDVEHPTVTKYNHIMRTSYPVEYARRDLIRYSRVTEQIAGNGKKIYEFTSFDTNPDIPSEKYHYDNTVLGAAAYHSYSNENIFTYNPRPFSPDTDMSFERGLLTKLSVFDKNNIPVEVTTYEYEFNPSGYQPAAVTAVRIDSDDSFFSGGNLLWSFNIEYYLLVSKWHYLKTTRHTVYDSNNNTNSIETLTTYTYSPLSFQLTEVAIETSSGEKIITRMKYPQDYGSITDNSTGPVKGIKILQDRNILNAVIEKYSVKQNSDGANGRVIDGLINTYKSDQPLVDNVYAFEVSNPKLLSTYTVSIVAGNSFSFDVNYKLNELLSYDIYGNLIERNKFNDKHSAYVWGYGNNLRIAEIQNAAASQVAYANFESPMDLTDNGGWNYFGTASYGRNSGIGYAGSTISKYDLPIGNYNVSFWAIRSSSAASISGSISKQIVSDGWQFYSFQANGVTSVSLNLTNLIIDDIKLFPVGSQMTTYTYNPLVGTTSITDPNERTTYYLYDGFNRPLSVKDNDGNIIKTYDYRHRIR